MRKNRQNFRNKKRYFLKTALCGNILTMQSSAFYSGSQKHVTHMHTIHVTFC